MLLYYYFLNEGISWVPVSLIRFTLEQEIIYSCYVSGFDRPCDGENGNSKGLLLGKVKSHQCHLDNAFPASSTSSEPSVCVPITGTLTENWLMFVLYGFCPLCAFSVHIGSMVGTRVSHTPASLSTGF